MNSEILDLMTLNDIRSNFALLDDWEDRYRYLIEIGRELPPLESRAKVEANKVRGCASQVWLLTDVKAPVNGGGPVLHFKGDSDALIVRGLIAVLFAMFDGRDVEDILKVDAEKEFASLGLKDHLTPQRSNGLASMVARIKADARQVLAA